MNKSFLTKFAFLSLSVVIFAGCTQAVPQNTTNTNEGSTEMMEKEVKVSESMVKEDAMMKKEDSAMIDKKYVEYSKETLASASDKRRVLFFYANWCPTCIPADKEFSDKMNQIPEDVVLIRANYNDDSTDQEEKDLATKYGVTYQHTFVQIDNNGEAVTKWNGGSLKELLTKIK